MLLSRRRLPAPSSAVAVAVAVIVVAGGCSDVDDHLRAGRIYEACRRSRTHPDEAPRFAAWLEENAHVDVTLVPEDDVAAALGGHVLGYGVAAAPAQSAGPAGNDAVDAAPRTDLIGLYTLTPRVPGGTLAVDPSGAEPASELVQRLPRLVRYASAPQLPVLDESDLEPAPPYASGGGGGDALTGLIDAVGAVGMGIGMAVGVAVAVPIGIVAGVAEGIGSFFDAIFGGGGRGAPMSPEDRFAPVDVEDPPELPRADALLRGPDHDAAQRQLTDLHARYNAAVDAERRRRVALATQEKLLDVTDGGECAPGPCRAVFTVLPASVPASALFRRSPTDPETCTALIAAPRPLTPPPQPPTTTTTTAGDELATAREALASLSLSLDGDAPEYVLEHPQRTARAASKEKTAAQVDDLRCDLKVKRTRFDGDRSPPDVVLRVTAGGAHTRFHTAYLGANVTSARFVVNDLDLVPGDRLRLSVVSRHDRSLGGGVVAFDGALPVVIENAAFRATCTSALPPALDDPRDPVARRKAEAHKAVDAFAAAAADLAALDIAAPRAKALSSVSKLREKARAAVVAWGGDAGFSDDDVKALVARLHDVDPLSVRSPPP